MSAANEWRAFLLAWLRVHHDRALTANELCRSAAADTHHDWAGTFPRTSRGDLPSAKSLGRILTGRIGHQLGDVVLRSVVDAHTKTRVYWVEHGHQPRQINRLAGADSTWNPTHTPTAFGGSS